MPVKMVKKPVKARVEVEKTGKPAKSEEVKVGEITFSKPTATVGFSASFTKNLGDYESVKVSVSLYAPVEVNASPGAFDAKVLDEKFAAVQAWVDAKMAQVLDEVDAEHDTPESDDEDV